MTAHRRTSQTRPYGRVFASSRGQAGYTVVELVVVMVVMGIVAVNAMPAFFSASRFEELGFADASAGALRFARKVAVISGCDTRVAIGASGYQVLRRVTDCATGAMTRGVARPGGGDWAEAAPTGVTVGTLDLYFDATGAPHDHVSSVPLTAPQSVAVGSRNITVEPVTGFVH